VPKTIQQPASASEQIPHIYIPEGESGLKIGSWVGMAKKALEGQSELFRREWLEQHLAELDEVRRLRPDWAQPQQSCHKGPFKGLGCFTH
jgi:hypothetical protein